jgi:hypothetical protein
MTERVEPAETSRLERRERGRRTRRLRLSLVLFAGLLLLGAAWIAITALLARTQLEHVRADVRELRAQIAAASLNDAVTTSSSLTTRADRAHHLTGGPAWFIASKIPFAGRPFQVIRGITAGIDDISSNALPQLVTASQRLDPAKLRGPDGTIQLAEIASVAPALADADQVMSAAAARIAALPEHTWLKPIDSANADVADQLTSLSHSVRSASLASQLVPPMLGAKGPKNYFIAFQNEAEARGTGGLAGAFAILHADQGRLSFTRFESDSELADVAADVSFGPDYDQLYRGAGTTTLYSNANLSPHFPYAAQIWTSMWHKKFGQNLDGAIAVDPTALSYLLAVTGPAALPDGSRVSSSNIVALTQSQVYARFPGNAGDDAARRAYLIAIALASSKQILNPQANTTALVKAAGQAIGDRRILVWSVDPALQAKLERTAASGAIPVTKAPYVGLSVVNDVGDKLDYYLDRKLDWTRTGCGATRDVTVTITLTNNAPASGLSPYVTASDRPSTPIKAGDNRLEVSYLATSGALMRSVTLDGVAATASNGLEHGHSLYTVDVTLPQGKSRTMVLRLREPAGAGAPVVLRQPLVRPLTVSLRETSC